MENCRNKIDQKVTEFISMISTPLSYKIIELDIKRDIKGTNDWHEWAGKVGIYVFVNDKDILYAGRALRNTYIGARIDSQVKTNNEVDTDDWNRVIKDPLTRIRLYLFEDDNADYWVAGLELFLIDNLELKYNKRRG